jgi:putative membrane protein
MIVIARLIVVVVALLHLYFLWLEMFAWTTKGPKVFRNFPKELFVPTKSMAANQGLYNGFLSAGLIWSLLITDLNWSMYVALFFLGCVAIAGIYGAFSVSKKIFYIQGLPALMGILLFLLSTYL